MPPDFPDTRDSLLLRIQDPSDRDAWTEFSTIYSPVTYRIARLHGLQDADAQDLAQRALMSVAEAIGRWESDPDRAKFRTWLSRVIRNAIIDALRGKRPDAAVGGSSLIDKLSQQPSKDFDEQFDRQSRREIFRRAARSIRCEFEPSTWNAFWLTTVDGMSPVDVAKQLTKTVGSVYTARSRVMARLRQKVREYE